MSFLYKCIDLTHTLESAIPTWSNTCGFKQAISLDYLDCVGQYKFRVQQLQMNSGIGTHMDAPSHCIVGAKNIADFDLNELIFDCFVIDVVEKLVESYKITVGDILDFEKQYGIISSGSCVLINTGWSRFWNEPDKYHNKHIFPSVSCEAANLLLARGVNAIGIDTLSPDKPSDGFLVHQIFLGAGKIIIENIANLHLMPSKGAYLLIAPMKIKDGTESPIRLIGLINK